MLHNAHMGGFIEVGLSRGYSYTQRPLGKPQENPWESGIIALEQHHSYRL
jgi:hypothetical protein